MRLKVFKTLIIKRAMYFMSKFYTLIKFFNKQNQHSTCAAEKREGSSNIQELSKADLGKTQSPWQRFHGQHNNVRRLDQNERFC